MEIIPLICTTITILVSIILIVFFIIIYNSLIRLRNNIDRAFSNIDVLLKQRHNELPNLVEAVKGYMKYEKKVMAEITKARTAYPGAKSIGEKAEVNNITSSALKNLFAVAENYPDLKASSNYLSLQKRISELEDMISDRREFYNDSVNTYNIRIEQIPYVFVARRLNYNKRELFEADEKEKKVFVTKFSLD